MFVLESVKVNENHTIRIFFDMDNEYSVDVDGVVYSDLAAFHACTCDGVQAAAEEAWQLNQGLAMGIYRS